MFVKPKNSLPAGIKSWSVDGAVLKIKGYQCASGESNANIYNTLVPLNYVLDWSSDVPTCGLGKLTLYSDSALTTATSGSPVNLQTNPTLTSAEGLMVPFLQIDNRTPFNQMIYFKGQNLGLTTQVSL